MKAGDIIRCDKNTEHWHASSKNSDVTYLALYGGEKPTIWTETLTQKYYDSVAEKLKNKREILINQSPNSKEWMINDN